MVLTHVQELDDAAAASAVVFASRYVQEPLPRLDISRLFALLGAKAKKN
jgi:glutamate decarboxylase